MRIAALDGRRYVEAHAGSPEGQQSCLGGAESRRRQRLLRAPREPAGAGVFVDRLLRQPGAGQRNRRPRPRRIVRASQRRQPRSAPGRQLSVRAAVRRRCLEGQARHRGRALRLRRREGGGGRRAPRPRRPLAASDPRGLHCAPPRARRRSRTRRPGSTGCANSTSSARSRTSHPTSSCRTPGRAARASASMAGSIRWPTASSTTSV